RTQFSPERTHCNDRRGISAINSKCLKMNTEAPVGASVFTGKHGILWEEHRASAMDCEPSPDLPDLPSRNVEGHSCWTGLDRRSRPASQVSPDQAEAQQHHNPCRCLRHGSGAAGDICFEATRG